MNKYMLIFFILFSLNINAQNIEIITFDQLETKINIKNDTTYILNFWATWCKPCVQELPYFLQLEKEMKNKKIKFLFVSLDFVKKKEQVNNFIIDKNWKASFYLLNAPNQNEWIDKIAKEWEGSIPATLMYNNTKKKKTFYEREFSYEELKAELLKFMK
jgi:thiol-disulfide isomerase/thioredoxin